jgi:predicted MFS family arabinose efflux permease
MVSLVGSWMQMTAQSWLVLILTDSPFKLGLVGTLQFAPLLVFTLYGGVLADRLPKRRILLATQSCLALFALVLAFLTLSGRVQFWHVALLAALVGTVRSFDAPARQAFFVEMVGREDLLNAIALNSTIFNLARVAGPALGGLVIKAVGTGWAFLANGLSFLAVIAALAAMTTPDRARPGRRGVGGEMREGLAYIARTPAVLGIIILLGLVSTFALNWNVLVPTFARAALGLDAGGYGLLMSSMGVGALTGSVALATFGGRGPRARPLLAGALSLGIGLAVLCLVRGPALAAAVLFCCGAAQVTYLASSNTTVQSLVPDDLRGRVMAAYFLVFGGVAPLGAFLSGSLAEHYGAPVTFGVMGCLTVAAVLAVSAGGRLAETVAAADRRARPETEVPAGDGRPSLRAEPSAGTTRASDG